MTYDKRHLNTDQSNQKDYSIGLFQHDEAIKYYFENVIRPVIKYDDGQLFSVPVQYGSPERWVSVQKNGFARDKLSNKIMSPLIMYRRTNMETSREYSRNVIPDNPNIHVNYSSQYSQQNRYDRFEILNNSVPQKQIDKVVIPNFVKLSYDCLIWTDKISHMNKLIEAINYADSSYWGDKTKFHFFGTIGGFDQSVELSDGEDRSIKCGFNITLDGYIIPDTVQKQVAEISQRQYSVSKINITESFNEQL